MKKDGEGCAFGRACIPPSVQPRYAQRLQAKFAIENMYTKEVPYGMMTFSWDEKKREENWESRKVDFAEAVGIFDDPEVIESIDNREDYGEERIQALGKTGGVFYLVVYTWRDEARHIITAWKVGDHGKRRYEALFAQRDRRDESQR